MREQLDISAQDLVRAQYERERSSRERATLLSERVDVLLLPTMAVTAPVDADALALRVAHALEEAMWPQTERWPSGEAAPPN